MEKENIMKENILEKIDSEVKKEIEASNENVMESIYFTGLLRNTENTNIINIILNCLGKLEDNSTSKEVKNSIVYTLAGNIDLLGLFLNKKFVSNYVIFLFQASEDEKFIKNLQALKCHHLLHLIKNRSIESVVNYILQTMATCVTKDIEIPKKPGKINQAIKDLKDFNFKKQDTRAVRKELQEIDYREAFEDRRTQEEKEADIKRNQELIEMFKKQAEDFGGENEYNKFLREEAKKSQPVKVITIQNADIDEVIECRKLKDYGEIRPEIKPVLDDIIDIYRAAFDIPIIMQKFSGTYVFADREAQSGEGQAYGVMQVVATGEAGEVNLITKNHKASALLKWLQNDYPIRETLKVARHNEVPSLENIMVKGYNYYPTFITRYALGFVKKEKHKNFKSFIAELRKDVEDRLYAIYKSEYTLEDKILYGADLFDASNRDRMKLIGAFTNAVIFLTGNGADNFDNAQIRCISAYSHQKEASYYTKFERFADGSSRGLSDAAQVRYIKANEGFTQNILDITHIKDKESFYKTVSWAYKELGQVYGSGEIPDIKKREPVVIGKTLSGELVDFDLGENSSFVTSIYAGSRSGKGVTTLSILAAIMAGGIGISYLDCKPDMVNCFWDMENRAVRAGKQGHVYAYDTHASQNRLGHTAMKSLTTQSASLVNSNIASALFILKNLQLITLTGQYKQRKGDSSYHVWIIDEVNNMLNILEAGYAELEKRAPKASAKDLNEEQTYIKAVMDFWQNLQVSVASGVNDTYGQCGYRFIVIGQNPGAMFKGGSKPTGKLTSGTDILRIIGNGPVNKYILGRGVNITGGFGSKAFHNDETRSSEEKRALENHRYFIMREQGQVNAGAKDESVLFQPFLTLNFDDVLASCWTGGLGKDYHYDSSIKKTDAAYPEMIKSYKRCINAALGLNTELKADVLNAADEGHGVVDEGTGFYGLVKMYYSKYGAEADSKVLDVALKPYLELEQMMREMKLIGEGSLFNYHSIEDFLYNFSVEAMAITNYDELLQKVEKNSCKEQEDLSDEEADGCNRIDIQENVYRKEGISEKAESEQAEIEEAQVEIEQIEAEQAKAGQTEIEPIKQETFNATDRIEEAETEDIGDMIIDLTNDAVEVLDKGAVEPSLDTVSVKSVKEPLHEGNSLSSGNDSSYKSVMQAQKACFNPMVKIQSLREEDAVRVDNFGNARKKSFNYIEDILMDELPELEDDYRKVSSIKFIDDALVKRNVKKRYQTFIRTVENTIGWINVDRLSMSSDRIVINNDCVIHVQSLGEQGYNLYEVMNFSDLLFNRTKRLRFLLLDGAVAERIIGDCGGDVFELLFSSLLTLQGLQVGNIKMTRNKRDYSKELAFKAEVERAEQKSKAKDALTENLFASGEVKKTSDNLAIADRIVRRAKRTRGNQAAGGVMAAQRFLNMTPMQALTGLVAGVFIGVGNLIRKAQSI